MDHRDPDGGRGADAVVVTDLDDETGEAAVGEIEAAGSRGLYVRADVSDEDQVARLVGAAADAFGRVDVLFNNVADMRFAISGEDADVTTMSVDFWDHVMNVNLRSVMLMCKHTVPRMRDAGGGAIVNNASISGIVAEPVRAAYGASKAAVSPLTRYVAVAHGADGIRANAVAPGFVGRDRPLSPEHAGWVAVRAEHVLTKRFGLPEDVAELVVFLASPRAGQISGQTVVVDGGALVRQPGSVEVEQRGVSHPTAR